MLKRAAPNCGLTVPGGMALAFDVATAAQPNDVFKALPDTCKKGFTIKFSGHDESFSPDCRRGLNSSRGRFWDGSERGRALKLIESATHLDFGQPLALIFQEYVRDPRLSGVFYAYAYPGRTLIEASSHGRRSYFEIRTGVVSREISVWGPHIRSSSLRHANALHVDACLQALRAEVDFDLDVEGFEVDAKDGVVLVQLRPIPEDMPRLAAATQPPAGSKDWYQTPLTWGYWTQGASMLDDDKQGSPAIMLKQKESLADCPGITGRLNRGDATLVVDTFDGFKLSHDPRYLPGTVQQRDNFSYVSVANTPLAGLLPGDIVEAFSDGDIGCIRAVPPKSD